MQEKMKEQQYEIWRKFQSLPAERLVDYIGQHEGGTSRALAILALSLKVVLPQRFVDDSTKSSLEHMRKRLALEEHKDAEQQRRAIDSLFRGY
jgi:hypothetical protein